MECIWGNCQWWEVFADRFSRKFIRISHGIWCCNEKVCFILWTNVWGICNKSLIKIKGQRKEAKHFKQSIKCRCWKVMLHVIDESKTGYKKRWRIMVGYDTRHKTHLGQSEEWIVCVLSAMHTCHIRRNMLSRICWSIGLHFKHSVDKLISPQTITRNNFVSLHK